MAKIYHPTDKKYNDVRANVRFTNGVGETDIPDVIKWFELKGFKIGEESQDQGKTDEFEGKSVDELKAYAEEHGIDIGKATSENGIIEKIKEAQQKTE